MNLSRQLQLHNKYYKGAHEGWAETSLGPLDNSKPLLFDSQIFSFKS